MNIITIAGVLGNDAEVKYLPDGTAICTFSVADSQGQEKPTIWHRCQLFGKRAESKLPGYLLKGAHVTVSGNLTQREYTDKDGQKKTAQDIRVQDVALQGGQRQQTEAPAARPASQREQNRERQYNQSRPAPQFADMDDDIPFAPFMARKALAV